MSNTFIPVKEYLKFFEDNFKGDRKHCYDYIFEGCGGEGYYCLYDSICRPEEMSYANIKRCLSEELSYFRRNTMTVKELIQELNKYNEDIEVSCAVDGLIQYLLRMLNYLKKVLLNVFVYF